MKSVSLSEAKDQLSALVDEASRTHEIVQITKHGKASAVLMAADDLESLHETLFWLSQPGIRDDIDEARASVAKGEGASAADLRREYGVPDR